MAAAGPDPGTGPAHVRRRRVRRGVPALHDGDIPYREITGTQGPLFYALLWVARGLSGQWAGSARLVAVTAGVVLVVVVAALARTARGRVAALVAAVLVGTSSILMRSTSMAESDGVAAALGASAVLAAARARTWRGLLAVAVLAGGAVSVKNALAAAAAVACLWLVGRRHGWWAAARTGVGATVTAVIVAAPFGVVAVVRQSVLLHADSGSFHPGANLGTLRRTLDDERLLLLLAAAALLTVVLTATFRSVGSFPAIRPKTADRTEGAGGVRAAVLIWCVLTVPVHLVNPHLWKHNVAATLVPLAVLVAAYLPDRMLVAAAVAVLVPWQVAALDGMRHSGLPTPSERQAMADLRLLTPAGERDPRGPPGPGRVVRPGRPGRGGRPVVRRHRGRAHDRGRRRGRRPGPGHVARSCSGRSVSPCSASSRRPTTRSRCGTAPGAACT